MGSLCIALFLLIPNQAVEQQCNPDQSRDSPHCREVSARDNIDVDIEQCVVEGKPDEAETTPQQQANAVLCVTAQQ